MAEEMQEQATETVKKETPDESLDIESQVKETMLSRVSHFKKQAEMRPEIHKFEVCFLGKAALFFDWSWACFWCCFAWSLKVGRSISSPRRRQHCSVAGFGRFARF